MPFYKRLKFFLLAVIAVTSLSAFSAKAAQPDPSANPVLGDIMKSGAKLYYLGTQNGLDGWFIVKNGHVQMAYSTPDKKGVIIGAMFGSNGENITSKQVGDLLQTHPDLLAQLNGAVASNSGASTITVPSTPSTTPTANTSSPGEQLMQQLMAAPGITVGTGHAQLYMVMDPNCPHCQATWRALKPSVVQGVLQIRMIPIGTKDTDNERAAAQFLHANDPFNVWDKYVNGDKSQLAGTPDATSLASVRANHALIDSWNIQATPYLVYRSKDGTVKIVQGELDKPEKLSVFLSDLGS